MLASPDQRGERHVEIVILPRRAFIGNTALALLVDEHQDERVLSRDGPANFALLLCSDDVDIADHFL